jgi:hypothetical protein
MAFKDTQLDKLSLKYCVITKAQRKEAKRQHTRKKRREAKNIEAGNPNYNRYDGWVA